MTATPQDDIFPVDVEINADSIGRYLFDCFLPRQKELFLDSVNGGFYERAVIGQGPDSAAQKRLLGQCRQIFQFSHGHLLSGQDWMRDTADHGYRFLHHYRDRKFGGWCFKVTPAGKVCDDHKNLYAHAFVLFALAHYYRMSPGEEVKESILHTLEMLEMNIKDIRRGGFIEHAERNWTYKSGLRLQNPHMHLLEALLAIQAAGIGIDVSTQISALFELFRECLFDAKTGTLAEYFTSNWRRDTKEGHRLEPGHHYEWIWILSELNRLMPELEVAEYTNLLMRGVTKLVAGDPGNGVADELDCKGNVLKSSMRIWAQTECLKAFSIHTQSTTAQVRRQTSTALLRLLFTRYLKLNGDWVEHFGADGTALRNDLPATTGYHITMALSEYLKAKF
ncbi:MAG: mannose/cellobiose epimerase-like protein (N-acyl-D-glucosamine 2-epimerase family) [Parasphingorhabdus sp.]|jgi:mannose/cellobiose epimerase-like protein (N-acyl-D-glucosamine 2-epimerase family)